MIDLSGLAGVHCFMRHLIHGGAKSFIKSMTSSAETRERVVKVDVKGDSGKTSQSGVLELVHSLELHDFAIGEVNEILSKRFRENMDRERLVRVFVEQMV